MYMCSSRQGSLPREKPGLRYRHSWNMDGDFLQHILQIFYSLHEQRKKHHFQGEKAHVECVCVCVRVRVRVCVCVTLSQESCKVTSLCSM